MHEHETIQLNILYAVGHKAKRSLRAIHPNNHHHRHTRVESGLFEKVKQKNPKQRN